MNGFFQWETVDFPFQLSREDGTTGILTDCKDVIISFAQGSVLLEKNMDSPDVALDIENDTVNVHLSQEETGQFMAGKDANVQINILYEDTERDASAEATLSVLRNLHREVMT